MASFQLPEIHDNPDGWGPPMDLAPKKFQDMPYAPFSKSDRLGRAADWTAYNNRYGRDQNEDSSLDFTVVDNKVIPRPGYGRGRGGYRSNMRGRGGRYGDRNTHDRDGGRKGGRGGKSNMRGSRGGYRPRWEDRRNIQREASVEVGSDWQVLEEISSSVLSKMSFNMRDEGQDIVTCGSVPFYDRSVDRITVRASKPLRVVDVEYPRVTTTDDSIIRRIAGSGEGTVFGTSSILAILMAAPRSVQSWDIIVQRIGGKLFFDKRDGSLADFITVSETSHDPPKDEKSLSGDEAINSFQKLSNEATRINDNFIQNVVSQTHVYNYEEGNPFLDEVEGKAANIAYRYRKWSLSEDIVVVARCDLDAAFAPASEGGEPVPITVRALNEYFDPTARQSTDWRGKLDTQRGAVLATEVKNNAAKLARWTAEAIMANSDRIKFGFVSRTRMNKNDSHVILGTQMYRPKEFASQIAFNTNNMWGVLKGIIDMCYKNLQDGEKGVFMKDPNKQILRLYRVPDDVFESEEDDDEDQESPQQMNLFM
ncbi:Translation initiation factor eIF3 subunit D [Gracilaria domingensis]|nr:Translation initiation factor eIF3 subunit D [Gracilaria domingensis]